MSAGPTATTAGPTSLADSTRLPSLRGDLELFPAPPAPDGTTEYTLYDPVTGQYKRLTWAEATVLRRWRPGETIEQLTKFLRVGTTLQPEVEDIRSFVAEAVASGLTDRTQIKPSQEIEAEIGRHRRTWLRWLFANYLYLRVPLFHPDRFLGRTLPWVRPLVSRVAVAMCVACGLLGAVLIASRLDTYFHTFLGFLTLRGGLAYALTLACIKAIHELAHGYAAKAYDVRVRSMGIVFIVFWPVPFSDVTDAWRLGCRWQRFMIGAAGVLAELALAGLSLLGWCLSPPGIMNSVFFLISSSIVISTLAVNLNPAMRFDGYYLLSDAWGVDNLQPRAFAFARWALRHYAFGLNVAPPEPIASRRRFYGLCAYSLFAWTYRFGLYLSIAILVYHKFAKAIGIVLFAVEIVHFIARPVWNEVKTLMSLRSRITASSRLVVIGTVLALLLAWLALPLPRVLLAPAIVVPTRSQVLYAPTDGRLENVALKRGDSITRGQILFEVASDVLDTQIRALRHEAAILETRRCTATLGSGPAQALPEILRAQAKTEAELRAIGEEKAKTRVHAIVEGILLEWEDGFGEGTYVSRDHVLGQVAKSGNGIVSAYLREEFLDDVVAGTRVRFYPADGTAALVGELQHVHRTRLASIPHQSLTTEANGPIPVVRSLEGELVPVHGYFEATVALDEPCRARLWSVGGVRVVTRAQSHLANWFGYAWTVILRESTF